MEMKRKASCKILEFLLPEIKCFVCEGGRGGIIIFLDSCFWTSIKIKPTISRTSYHHE